jgi:hypothetical protein
LDDLNQRIKDLKQQLKKNEVEQKEKERNLKEIKDVADDFAERVFESERREKEYSLLINLKNHELEAKN